MLVNADFKQGKEMAQLEPAGRNGLVRQKQGSGDGGGNAVLWVGDSELCLAGW